MLAVNMGVATFATAALRLVEFVADRAGSFEYYCGVPGHREAGMVGTLVVVE